MPSLTRGSSQGGLRQYNERVILHAVRLGNAEQAAAAGVAASDIARTTHLTPQTVSLITKRLLEDGLLLKGTPQRGKVGQPSVPLSLNPDGAYAIGIELGRRSLELLLVDFTGAVRQRVEHRYAHADPDRLLPLVSQGLKDIGKKLGPAGRARLQGVGVAAPLAMGGWQELLGLPPAVAKKWAQLDLAAAIAELTPLPVTVIKDTAAACIAELVAGRGRSVKGFLYLFVDTFIGGGLVIDNHLHAGRHGNAGAVGSLQPRGTRGAEQLIARGSLLSLERAWAAARLATDAAADARALQAPWLPHTQAWLKEAGSAIAQAVHASACLLDIDGTIVDGSFSRELLTELLTATNTALSACNWEGVAPPTLLAGSIGNDARAWGAAWLPLHNHFAPDHALFLKSAPD